MLCIDDVACGVDQMGHLQRQREARGFENSACKTQSTWQLKMTGMEAPPVTTV